MKAARLLSIIVLLAMVLSACAPAATPVPTLAPTKAAQAPTQPPVPTTAPAVPTTPPATVAPTKPPATAAPTTPPATAAATIGPTRPAATQAPATLPLGKSNKCLRYVSGSPGGENATLDTSYIISGEAGAVVAMSYERLAHTDSLFKLTPQLATSWEHNADSTEWTYYLRKGVKFHDGHEMTSKDVVWTFQRLIDPKVASEAASLLGFLKPEGIIAVDDYTVKFKTDKPTVELDMLVATKNCLIVPYGAQKADLQFSGNGTGPWVPVDYKPGQTPHIFNAFKDYWQKGLPKTECVEMYVVAEEATRLAALQSGQIDVVGINIAAVDALKKNPDIKVLPGPPSGFETFSMWVDTKPFNDIRVRQALKMVVDRQAMVDTLLLGFGEVGDDNPIAPSSPDAWRSKPAPRDVAGAKKLLADAGYGPSNPLKLDLYTAVYGTAFVPKSEMFRQQALEAGIIINVIVGPTSEYWSNVWLKQPFINSTWSLRLPAEGLALNYRQNSKNKETHWERPDYDALLDKAGSEPDDAKRSALYKQAEKMLTEEGGIIVPFFTQAVNAIRTNCTGFVPHINIVWFELTTMECKR